MHLRVRHAAGEDDRPDDHQHGRGTSASVTQKVVLNLPQATALHLDAATLTFDISKLKDQDNYWQCVYGSFGDKSEPSGYVRDSVTGDVSHGPLDSDFWGQTEVLPLNTAYKTEAYPKISLESGTGGSLDTITTYPPVKLSGGTTGELVQGSKRHFVCYRSFILQKFSNLGSFKLSVQRSGASYTANAKGGGPSENAGTFQMYIQDNACDTWGSPTGLFELKDGGTVNLLPKRLTVGTTGARRATWNSRRTAPATSR